jgi:diaminohydroxyphosphoribosylaminopyrimidine deaminase/5-amino-6-(5-phosphoribosylamino)uracil reductase
VHVAQGRKAVGSDEGFMQRALALARGGLGLARPNPMVGAVVVQGGEVVGEGWHEGPGTPHAEVHALRAAGERARGATLYTTLEPCSHFGRTPPCAPAVLQAGIARVVAGVRDPNPIVDGRGFEILRAAAVEVAEGVRAQECGELIQGFAKHARTGLPFVTLKMAASLDGKVAARDGSSRWITAQAARRDAHGLRAASGAIVVGAGTVVADDPALTVRIPGYRGRQPLRVIVDAHGRVPPDRAVLTDGAAPTVIATADRCPSDLRRAWERCGAEVVVFEPSVDGAVPPPDLVAWLGKREVHDVLVEGGPTLAWSMIAVGSADRFVLYLAPKLVGGSEAPGVLGGPGVRAITDALPLRIRAVERIGDGLKVVADVHRDR